MRSLESLDVVVPSDDFRKILSENCDSIENTFKCKLLWTDSVKTQTQNSGGSKVARR